MQVSNQSYLLLIAMFSLTDSIPTQRQPDRHKEDNSRHSTEDNSQHSMPSAVHKSTSTDNLNLKRALADQPNSSSLFSRFAKTKPTHPPWISEKDIKPTNTSQSERNRRSADYVGESVCDTLSTWSQLDDAVDFNGRSVKVMTMIDQDGARQLQYFFETFCSSDDEPPCRGIDTSAYTSKCTTTYIWVNAFVRNELNQVGWAKIKIRGSCDCSLWSISAEPTSIWEDLLRKRR